MFENEVHCLHIPAPARRLIAIGTAAGRGQAVVLRTTVVLGGVPLAVDPAAQLETLQGGV